LLNPLFYSKSCGHSYSSNSIKQYLRGKGVIKKCPAVGCDKNISLADLETNEDLTRQVRNKRRKEEGAAYARGRERGRQIVDSDDDEIIG
jgi:SUMO ligase MMS21 Smc5/6 complex component